MIKGDSGSCEDDFLILGEDVRLGNCEMVTMGDSRCCEEDYLINQDIASINRR